MITDTTPPRTMGKGEFTTVLLDALKAMLDLHDMNMVTAVYPEGSNGRQHVEAVTQQARLTLLATRRYGQLYAWKGGENA